MQGALVSFILENGLHISAGTAGVAVAGYLFVRGKFDDLEAKIRQCVRDQPRTKRAQNGVYERQVRNQTSLAALWSFVKDMREENRKDFDRIEAKLDHLEERR